MELIKDIAITVFMGAWVIGVASWFFGAYEFITLHLFIPSSFNFGKLALTASEQIPFDPFSIQQGAIIKTRNGKFKFVGRQECLFIEKFQLFAFRLHTPFPIKGKIRWTDGSAKIEGRLPLGTTLFIVAWLVGWTAGAVGLYAQDASTYLDPAVLLFSGIFLLLGWGFAAGMYMLSVPHEIRRARSMVEELRAYLLEKRQ